MTPLDCLWGPINTHKTIDLKSEIQHAQILFLEVTKQGSDKMIPKLETTEPYLFNLLCKKTKTKKQIKTIIITVKKEKKSRKQCLLLPRFLQVILRLHSS